MTLPDRPLVSVITPTWQRTRLLLARCMPSVQAQTWPAIEHLIVSDGPDPDLGAMLAAENWLVPVRFAALAAHAPERHWGGPARRRALELAKGDLIAYVDDDDALRPRHTELLVNALACNPEAGFAWSQMARHCGEFGGTEDVIAGPLGCGGISTQMLMHRRDLTTVATWGSPSATEDWELVFAWLSAGVKHEPVGEVTVDQWPCATWASAT